MRQIWQRWMDWVVSRFYNLRGTTHRHFGNSYADIAEYCSAIDDFTRAINFDPNYAEAYYNRGVLYWRELDNHYRSIRDLTRAIELDPSRAEAIFNRGIAYKLRGDYERAVADFKSYLDVGRDAFWREAAKRQLTEIGEMGPGVSPVTAKASGASSH
jgi:tetratricopeptide (TPR) repeat protein